MSGGLLICVVTRYETKDETGELVATDVPYSHVLVKHRDEWQIDSIYPDAEREAAVVRAISITRGVVKPGEPLPGSIHWASWL